MPETDIYVKVWNSLCVFHFLIFLDLKKKKKSQNDQIVRKRCAYNVNMGSYMYLLLN